MMQVYSNEALVVVQRTMGISDEALVMIQLVMRHER